MDTTEDSNFLNDEYINKHSDGDIDQHSDGDMNQHSIGDMFPHNEGEFENHILSPSNSGLTPQDINNDGARLKRTQSFPDDLSHILKPKSNSDPTSRCETPLLDFISDNSITEIEPNTYIQNKKSATIPRSKTNTQLSSQQETKQNDIPSISSIANISTWWKKYVNEKRETKRKKLEQAEEVRMRYKLQYHFMTPFQKYKLGRRPWKLAVQILKIFIVTTQVMLFGTDRFAAVAFVKHTNKAFAFMLIDGYDTSDSFSYYSRGELVNAIKHANYKYLNVRSLAIGRYWYPVDNQSMPLPMQFCEESYVSTRKNASSGEIDYYADTITVCEPLNNKTNFNDIMEIKTYFDRIISLQLKFNLNAIYLNGLKMRHRPECFSFNNSIYIDNSKHDGRLRVSLKASHDVMPKCPHEYKINSKAIAIKDVLIAFDCLVITICALSFALCMRSLIKSIMLAKAAQRYFMEYKHEILTKWDLFELINKWFGVIIFSDLLSIIGSIYKIRVDERDIRYYNICSVLLGLGVVAVWIGLLRFFTYMEKYNILLITLRSAAPNLLRFMCCAMFMFFGFTFCGWIVLGPYHKKFVGFLTTAECLFSLLNGDDMYPTFATMSKRNASIWVFSKVYIYVFVSLFIYVVLSTFISIVGDTYERLKDYGRMPPTRIEIFMTGVKMPTPIKSYKKVCNRCLRESGSAQYPGFQLDQSSRDRMTRMTSISSSQLSIVSASLE